MCQILLELLKINALVSHLELLKILDSVSTVDLNTKICVDDAI